MNRKYCRILIIILFLICLPNLIQAQKFYQADDVSQATLKLYPVDDESQADIRVCIVFDETEVTGECIWFEVDNAAAAEITTIFVDEESQANFKIILVENKVQAGFANEDKKQLYLELTKRTLE